MFAGRWMLSQDFRMVKLAKTMGSGRWSPRKAETSAIHLPSTLNTAPKYTLTNNQNAMLEGSFMRNLPYWYHIIIGSATALNCYS